MRSGNWKAIRLGFGDKVPVEVYDLSKDLAEENNIADKHPEVVAKMKELLAKAHVDSPDWPVPAPKPPGGNKKKTK